MLLTGCQPEPEPDLMARVQRDCEAGHEDACSLFQGFLGSKVAIPASKPQRLRSRSSQAARNADALMLGVERARAAPRSFLNAMPSDGEI